MISDATHPPSPPRRPPRRRGALRGVITALVLVAAVSAVAVVGRRLRHRTAVERVLGRDLQPGMPLAEVTARLQRVGVEFTMDSITERTPLVRFGREVGRNGMVTEQQIVFDGQARLLGLRTVSQLRGP